MPNNFPIFAERTTAGIAGILHMPQVGYLSNLGFNTGFAPNVPVDGLVDYWCGPRNAYCDRWALALAAMPPGHRGGQLSGWFGNLPPDKAGDGAYVSQHREATIEAIAEKTCAEADAINIEAAADVVAMMQTELKRLGDEVKALRNDNAELRQRVDDCEEDRRNLHREMREMRDKLARLEAK